MIFTISACSTSQQQDNSLKGEIIPSFDLLSLDSTSLHIDSTRTGRNKVIFYFTPECPYCNSMIKEIVENMDLLKSVEFVMVSHFNIEDIKSFYNKYALNRFTNIRIGQDNTGFVRNYFNILGVPYFALYGDNQTFIAGINGKVNLSFFNEYSLK